METMTNRTTDERYWRAGLDGLVMVMARMFLDDEERTEFVDEGAESMIAARFDGEELDADAVLRVRDRFRSYLLDDDAPPVLTLLDMSSPDR